MRSFWELDHWTQYDAIIVGGGIVGISTAIEIATRHPRWRVLLLERGLIPSGASTRNAGFACFGSLSEICSDIDLMGAPQAAALVSSRLDGLSLLRKRCEGADIGYTEEGGSEIYLAHHPSTERVKEVNNLLLPIVGANAFTRRDDLIETYGLHSSVQALFFTPLEGTLHSGKLISYLWSLARTLGVDIRTGAEVVGINDSEFVTATVRANDATYTVRSNCMVIATNAMIPALVGGIKLPSIVPGRGQVLVTAPIPGLQLRGSFHYDEGYYYFRSVGNRVLLGGGRNIDFNAERTVDRTVTDEIQQALEHLLRTVIVPHNPDVAIDHRWAGTMAFTETKQPYIGFVSDHCVVAFSCNGMGIARSSTAARQAVELIAKI